MDFMTKMLVWKKTDGKCWYCGVNLNLEGSYSVKEYEKPFILRFKRITSTLVDLYDSDRKRCLIILDILKSHKIIDGDYQWQHQLDEYEEKEIFKNKTRPNGFNIDHIIPKNKEGTDEIDNLVPCCISCNSAKCNRHVEEFRITRARQKFKQKYGIDFSYKQVEFLKEQFDIDIVAEFTHLFYFEEKGFTNAI